MTGYRNAPEVEPQVGDIVRWHDGSEVPVFRVDVLDQPKRWPISNSLIDGRLNLNDPSTIDFVRRADSQRGKQ